MPPLRQYYLLLLLLITLLSSACTQIGIDKSDSLFISRYSEYMLGNIPEQYNEKQNPLMISEENITAGKTLYQIKCIMCHGDSGEGNGPVAKSLAPQPANLTLTRILPIATDAFLFWTLSEGGQLFETAMPSFKEQLSDKEIWQLSLYINSGFSI